MALAPHMSGGPIKMVCLQNRLLNDAKFQNALGVIRIPNLSAVEAMVEKWNMKLLEAINKIAPQQPLLPLGCNSCSILLFLCLT